MKKYIMFLTLSVALSQGLYAKAIGPNGDEIDQKETCAKLKESLPGVHTAIVDYYAVKNSKIAKCEEIELIDMKEVSESDLYGFLIGLNYSFSGKSECKKSFYERILEKAITEKINTKEGLQKIFEEKNSEIFEKCES